MMLVESRNRPVVNVFAIDAIGGELLYTCAARIPPSKELKWQVTPTVGLR